jgi:hypothetical protein
MQTTNASVSSHPSQRPSPAVVSTLGVQLQTPEGIDRIDTQVLRLSPEVHQALLCLAPVKRRSRLALVLFAGVAAVGLFVVADPSAREFVRGRSQALASAHAHTG